ncbi:MAG: TonB-dependent receptor [Gemmatimonadetes bacterium]|nr:TonB-dependent receptor [Gemmatimonadota bacterium]
MKPISVLLVCAGVSLVPSTGSAQTVQGVVREVVTNRRLSDVIVSLTTTLGDSVAAFRTDDSGGFAVVAPRPGQFFVSARRIGYDVMVDGPVRLADGQIITVVLHIKRIGTELDPVTVTAEAEVPHLRRVGFYQRKATGLGFFIDREYIEERFAAREIADLLRAVPGVTIQRVTAGRARVQITGCPNTRVLVDNLEMGSDWQEGLGPGDIEGIEVFRRITEIPVQYAGPRSGCGVILIWTRLGRNRDS